MAQALMYSQLKTKEAGFKPAYEKIIVRPDMLKSAHIHVPKNVQAQHQSVTGIVVAIGPDTGLPFQYAIGDRVMYTRYSGAEIILEEDGEEARYLVLNYQDILSSIDDAEVEGNQEAHA